MRGSTIRDGKLKAKTKIQGIIRNYILIKIISEPLTIKCLRKFRKPRKIECEPPGKIIARRK